MLSKKNNFFISKNKFEVLKSFAYDEVREDHYNLKNAIYKFSGDIKIYEVSKKRFDEILENIKKKLYKIHIIPSELFVFEESIEIRWIANNFQIVDCKEKYLKLSLQFAEYLDYINIKGLEANTGSLLDDPTELNKNYKNKFDYNPKFNKKCFGNKKIEIDIIDFRN